jgi:hypothetical protein
VVEYCHAKGSASVCFIRVQQACSSPGSRAFRCKESRRYVLLAIVAAATFMAPLAPAGGGRLGIDQAPFLRQIRYLGAMIDTHGESDPP